ncbi:MAG: alpha/beta hydrolase, partial [Alphaproteobacteria bacterium]|nr:alpha/beta hydrolase [Alphaproteobacteria bacterium]
MAARAAALNQQLASAQPPSQNKNNPAAHTDPFDQAVVQEIYRRLHDLATGIKAYRSHPYRRDLAAPAILWRDGTTRLLDFRPAGGQPVLFIPSLVNRAYILDLSAERSLLRWLAAETGLRPLLIDWDA